MPAKAYNPTASPVVIDDDGHTLPGRAHGDVDTSDDRVLSAVAGGRLVLTNERTHVAALERAAERAAEREADAAEAPALAVTDEIPAGDPLAAAADTTPSSTTASSTTSATTTTSKGA